MFMNFKNWETWAATLWLDNVWENCEKKGRYYARCQERGIKPTYTGLIRFACLENGDVSWYNSRISRREVTEFLQDDFIEWQEYN